MEASSSTASTASNSPSLSSQPNSMPPSPLGAPISHPKEEELRQLSQQIGIARREGNDAAASHLYQRYGETSMKDEEPLAKARAAFAYLAAAQRSEKKEDFRANFEAYYRARAAAGFGDSSLDK